MPESTWKDGLPEHEVRALSATACDLADELLPCTCGAGLDPPCNHKLACPARFRAGVATAICEAKTFGDRHRAAQEPVLDREEPLQSLYELAQRAVLQGAKLRMAVSWTGQFRKVELHGNNGSNATIHIFEPRPGS